MVTSRCCTSSWILHNCFLELETGAQQGIPYFSLLREREFIPRFVIVRIWGLRVAGLEVSTCTVAVFCFCRRSLSGFGRSKKKRNLNLRKANLDRRGLENYTGRSSQILMVMKSRSMEWMVCLACLMEMIILFENVSAPSCHLQGLY